MLSSVLIKFLTCHINIILNLWEVIMLNVQETSLEAVVAFTYFVGISNFLIILNSATNWVIYFKWRRTQKGGMTPLLATSEALFATSGQLFVQQGSTLAMRSSHNKDQPEKTLYGTLRSPESFAENPKREQTAMGINRKIDYGARERAKTCSSLFLRVKRLDEHTLIAHSCDDDCSVVTNL